MMYSLTYHHRCHCSDEGCKGNCRDYEECCGENYSEAQEDKE